MPRSTPWGTSQWEKRYAPGVVFYDTASHGGFEIAADVHAKWPAPLRNFKTFAGGRWYEEDCDYGIVVLAMPELFELGTLEATVRSKIGDERLSAFFESDRGRKLVARANAWRDEQAANGTYYAGGGCTGGLGWNQRWQPYDESLPALITTHEHVPMDMPNKATRAELEARGYEIHEKPRKGAA